MKKITIFVFLLFALSSLVFADSIKIGIMCPLTGKWAKEGQDMQNIVTLLNEQVNAGGGVHGKKIELVIENDEGTSKHAIQAAKKLAKSGIVAVIGGYGSAVTEATQLIYDQAEIVQIATGATSNNLVEKKHKELFRICPNNEQQSDIAARILLQMGYHNIAILHDGSSYSFDLAEGIRKRLEKFRSSIVFFDKLIPGWKNYTAVINNIQESNPDVIFFTGYYPEAGILLKQKHQMGFNIPMIGGDACNNTELIHIAGKETTTNFYCISPPLPKDLMDGGKASTVLTEYKNRFQSLPGSTWSVLTGDAYNILVEALKNVSDIKPETIANYLYDNLDNYSGLTGKISFNRRGDRKGNIYRLYKIDSDGNFDLQPVNY